MIIAIDGPAGAGKSTIARGVAMELGLPLIDTGAIYRAVALRALAADVPLQDGPACARLARQLEFRFELDTQGHNHIFCDGDELGDRIRHPRISQGASEVSAHPEVRQALLTLQRDLGRAHGAVLEGRDIGTVVFPDADLKIFLTASAPERARRRVDQLAERGQPVDYDETLAQIRARDARDTSRAHAPLRQADDAVAIDTTSKGVDALVARISQMARERGA